MEDIARRNGWDPIDFRLQNINEAGFVDPFDKFTVRTCGLRECVEQGRRLCDWDRKRKEYDAFNKTSPNLKKEPSWHGAFFLQNRRLSAPTGKQVLN